MTSNYDSYEMNSLMEFIHSKANSCNPSVPVYQGLFLSNPLQDVKTKTDKDQSEITLSSLWNKISGKSSSSVSISLKGFHLDFYTLLVRVLGT